MSVCLYVLYVCITYLCVCMYVCMYIENGQYKSSVGKWKLRHLFVRNCFLAGQGGLLRRIQSDFRCQFQIRIWIFATTLARLPSPVLLVALLAARPFMHTYIHTYTHTQSINIRILIHTIYSACIHTYIHTMDSYTINIYVHMKGSAYIHTYIHTYTNRTCSCQCVDGHGVES